MTQRTPTRPQVIPTNAVRVSKRNARKLYNAHVALIMVPCNEWPFSPMSSSFPMHSSDHEDAVTTPPNDTFDIRVNSFIYYNCSHEQGYYPAFYANERDCIAHNITPLNLER